MDRLFISIAVTGVLISALAGGVGYYFYRMNNAPAQPQQPTAQQPVSTTPAPISQPGQGQSQEVVQQVFNAEVAGEDNIRLYKTVLHAGYALQVWKGDNMAGEALLQYEVSTRQWQVITWGGGSWSTDGLVEFGVPADTAAALVAGLGR
jgi:hypothetical protein